MNFESKPKTSTDLQDTDMNLKQLAAGGVIAAATLVAGTGCKPITNLVADSNNAGQEIKTGDDFKITQNPNPQKGYKLHVKVKDAPGTFDRFGGGAWFDISNIKDCGYFLGGSFQGTVGSLQRSIHIPFNKISDNEYEGKFYTDWAQDGDFFVKGVCHWQFVSVSMGLNAGKEGDTSFGISLQDETFVPDKPLVRFYRKKVYPKLTEMDNYVDDGVDAQNTKDLSYFKPGELFSITMTLKEIK